MADTPSPMPPHEQPPLQQPRRRRQHRRSRNGCYTCKQRHIRCDEQKPMCTNCLVRGGDCGYPSRHGSSSSAPDSNGEGSSELFDSQATADPASPPFLTNLEHLNIDASWATLSSLHVGFDVDAFVDGESAYLDATTSDYHGYDYFDTLATPLQSVDLTHHLNQFHTLTHGLAPHFPTTTSTGISSDDAGLSRSCLLLSAMHYSWTHGSLGDTEEEYLHHMGEAIREVNEHISDPSASDRCANLLAALALAESGIGNVHSAEIHLNGLLTLINWQTTEEWQGQLDNLFHGMVLVYVEHLRAGLSSSGSRTTGG